MFLHLSVILFTGGCPPQCMLGYTHPLDRQHPREVHTLPRKHTPSPGSTPPRKHPPEAPPREAHPPRSTPSGSTPPMVTAADGTHPTGMHSCLIKNFYDIFSNIGSNFMGNVDTNEFILNIWRKNPEISSNMMLYAKLKSVRNT